MPGSYLPASRVGGLTDLMAMKLPSPPCVLALVALVSFFAITATFGGCPFKNGGSRDLPAADPSAVVVEGALTPTPIPAGTPHTMTVTVTNTGTVPVEVRGVDISRTLPDGRAANTWTMGPRGFQKSVVDGGDSAIVFSRSGRDCGNAGNYEVHVVVHTNLGDLTDTFSYRFT